jgi:uncharacterized protein with PQ loop repeat
MGKAFLYFWVVFIGYFIFIHPAIIYYNIADHSTLPSKDPRLASFYVGLSIVLWVSISIRFFALIYKYSFRAKKGMENIMQNGISLKANILEVKELPISGKKTQSKEIMMELRNLKGERIIHQMTIKDLHPEEERFQVGKSLDLRLDSTFKHYPYLILEGSHGRINYTAFLIWAILNVGILFYYFYAYQTENNGSGWQFISLEHPLLSSALMLLLFAGIGYIFIYRLLFRKIGWSPSNLPIKFKGVRATAQVTQVEQTGAEINHQPELRFELEFVDKNGKIQKASLKKIIPLLQLDQTKLKERTIFYLPDQPQRVMFASDIDKAVI